KRRGRDQTAINDFRVDDRRAPLCGQGCGDFERFSPARATVGGFRRPAPTAATPYESMRMTSSRIFAAPASNSSSTLPATPSSRARGRQDVLGAHVVVAERVGF